MGIADMKIGRKYQVLIRGGLTGPPTFSESLLMVYRGLTKQSFPPYAEQVLMTEPRKRTMHYIPVKDVLKVSPA